MWLPDYLILLSLVVVVIPQEDDSLRIPENALGLEKIPVIRPQPGWNDVCFCSYGEPICQPDHTCRKDKLAACFHAAKEVYNGTTRQMETHHEFGCAMLEAGSQGSYFTCNSYRTPQIPPKSISCCYEGHLCNRNITPPPYVNAKEWDEMSWEQFGRVSWWPIFVIVGATMIVFGTVFYLLYTWRLKREKRKELYFSTSESEDLLDMDSGSGSGSKALNQRTVALNLEILETIGRGRYGDVRKATYKGSLVAVKTFYTTDEESWRNERDIYQTTMLNHKNILQYVAADISSEDSITHMLLITDFHELGSLSDYLRRDCALSVKEALDLAHSIVCGIEHLHSSLLGTDNLRKPQIAHRDIKSKNIIVKREGVCCVADFGLAVRYDNGKLIPEKVNIQVGTKRYMAPEVLSRTLQPSDFSQFKMSDMYSYALVVWEILRRVEWQDMCDLSEGLHGSSVTDSSGYCEGSDTTAPLCLQHRQKLSLDLSNKAKPYVPPFEGMVDNDPELEDMRKVVCEQNKRPPLESAWQETEGPLQRLTQLMVECWSSNPQCRHSSLKMKMELAKIIRDVGETKQPLVSGPENSLVTKYSIKEIPLPRSPPLPSPPTPSFPFTSNSSKLPSTGDSGVGKSRDGSSQKSFEQVAIENI